MRTLPAYTTTVVGAYSVPRWYEVLEQQVEAGLLSRAEMADAQWRASQAALVDQEVAGIDIPNGGEMHRRGNNRHAPPNAMLNHFWARIPGFAKDPKAEYGLVTRPKAITDKDENVFHPAAVCTGQLTYGDLGLVDEFERVRANSRKPEMVKVTMTGPHMLCRVAYDEYYDGDLARMMLDMADIINRNLRDLQAAGCEHVQLDEPLFAITDDHEMVAAVEANNACFDGITAFRWLHVCQGNYAVGADYDGQIGHRYFDFGRYPAELICRIDCDAIMNEGDMTPRYDGLLKNQQLCIGAADVQDLNVETAERLMQRVVNWSGSWLAPEQTLLSSSCGLNHLPRHIAFGKLHSLTGARELLRAKLRTAT
jgi:5-methyltetrahydropteroyltriglutamate--homocysteine methyltransferase